MAHRYLFLRGDVDLATAPALLEDLRLAIDTNDDDLVVDCFDVTFIGVAGVSALLVAHNELVDEGRTLTVRYLSPVATRMFGVLGLDHLLTPPGRTDAAIRS